MPIFELTPINLDHPDWVDSPYRELALVRARDELRARELAGWAFKIATPRQIGAEVKQSPWRRADLVGCRLVESSEYDQDGDEAILEPEGRNSRLPSRS